MEKKTVVARIKVIKGRENDYLSLVTPLIESSKGEAGNLFYSVYQEIQNPSHFIVYEEYINEDAFDAHCSTQHFQNFVNQVKPLLAEEIDIQLF